MVHGMALMSCQNNLQNFMKLDGRCVECDLRKFFTAQSSTYVNRVGVSVWYRSAVSRALNFSQEYSLAALLHYQLGFEAIRARFIGILIK